jgi:predicted acylesterase/phospholipase RssA
MGVPEMSLTEQNSAGDRPPNAVCDIVMKGGITSGVVYPLALFELSIKYRFSSIGGTSAGAMAAAAAAAAEYGRGIPGAGFKRLKAVPNYIGPKLLSLFQPTPKLKPLFVMFVAGLNGSGKWGRILGAIRAAIRGFLNDALIGAGIGFLIAVLLAWETHALSGAPYFGAAFALIGMMFAVIVRVFITLFVELPKNDYGLCPGIQQLGETTKGFTDWLAELIDEAAGRDVRKDPPLTFGDLLKPLGDRKPINLAMMTTCLTERRPYTLPMESPDKSKVADEEADDKDNDFLERAYGFAFKKSEWDRLFPKRIIGFMVANGRKCPSHKDEGEDFYYFPEKAKLPVVVAARMSLSFPGLISAVPLWRRDPSYNDENKSERLTLRRCLFSDGGLSSNFPIHFFDHLLPNSPTFAISLDEFDPKRSKDPEKNVWLPSTPEGGINIQIQPFEGLVGFLMRLVDSAKDWQDNLQSVLPGYRERIVHIGLLSDEGGLNLTMDKDKVTKLAEYGGKAGRELRDEFDFDEHRWRRFLVAMARVEETLDEVETAYKVPEGGADDFSTFLKKYAGLAKQYPQDPVVLTAMLDRGDELARLGDAWRTHPTIREGKIPEPDTNLRISPKP